jgi:hypothetical protein
MAETGIYRNVGRTAQAFGGTVSQAFSVGNENPAEPACATAGGFRLVRDFVAEAPAIRNMAHDVMSEENIQ